MAAEPEIVQSASVISSTALKNALPWIIGGAILGLWITYLTTRVGRLARKMKNRTKAKPVGTCPLDGGKLVPRNGKFGPFIGCSNFPNCRYTQAEK